MFLTFTQISQSTQPIPTSPNPNPNPNPSRCRRCSLLVAVIAIINFGCTSSAIPSSSDPSLAIPISPIPTLILNPNISSLPLLLSQRRLSKSPSVSASSLQIPAPLLFPLPLQLLPPLISTRSPFFFFFFCSSNPRSGNPNLSLATADRMMEWRS
ncbi:hypothetical protein CsSME_00018314 [Camellia sinensis var. sinensis]